MTKNKTPDILQRPVHPKTTEKTRIRELHEEGKIPRSTGGTTLPPEPPKLPKEEPVRKSKTGLVRFEPLRGFAPMQDAQKVRKTAALKARLQVVHANVVTPTGDKTPPCDECKTAACCSAFVVHLSPDEYHSGLYAPHAIEITPEVAKQLRGKLLSTSVAGIPMLGQGITHFYLEGRLGQPCPFLGADKRCTIYNIRPAVCRGYSCVGDSRITQGMRDGTEPIQYTEEWLARKVKDEDA